MLLQAVESQTMEQEVESPRQGRQEPTTQAGPSVSSVATEAPDAVVAGQSPAFGDCAAWPQCLAYALLCPARLVLWWPCAPPDNSGSTCVHATSLRVSFCLPMLQ